jgi:hypothetical protein
MVVADYGIWCGIDKDGDDWQRYQRLEYGAQARL